MDLYKKKYLKYKAKYLKLKGGGEIIRFKENGTIVRNLAQRKSNRDDAGNVLLLNHPKNPPSEIWSRAKFHERWTTCLNVMWKGHNQHIYGTSIPDQYSDIYTAGYNSSNGAPPNTNMYNVLGYFMYGLGVSHFVSLHACSLPTTWNLANTHYERPSGCAGNPTGSRRDKNRASSELNTWNKLKGIYQNNDPNVRFHDILIKDMTVGSIYRWFTINNLPFGDNKKDSQVFHCLAGMGRTGSVLLLKLMKYFILDHNGEPNCRVFNTSPDFLHNKFCFRGINSSTELTNELYQLMINNLTLYSPDDDHELLNYNIRNNDYNERDTPREVFNINTHFNTVLFLGRINTILICLWFHLYKNNRLGGIREEDRHPIWMYCRLFKIPTYDEYYNLTTSWINIFNHGELVNMSKLFIDANSTSPFYHGNIPNEPVFDGVDPDLVRQLVNYPRDQWVGRFGVRFNDIPIY